MTKRRHSLGIRSPLYRGWYGQQTGRLLLDGQSLPHGTGPKLRQILSARRNIRFRLVPVYNTAGLELSVSGSRQNILAHRATSLPCKSAYRVTVRKYRTRLS